RGAMWLSDSVTGFRLLNRTQVAQKGEAPAERGRGMRLLRDRRRNMWAATGGQGLWRVRLEQFREHGAGHTVKSGAQPVPYIERATSLTGLLGDGVYSLLEDRDGNVWAGTTEGVNRLTARRISQMIDLGIVRGLEVT